MSCSADAFYDYASCSQQQKTSNSHVLIETPFRRNKVAGAALEKHQQAHRKSHYISTEVTQNKLNCASLTIQAQIHPLASGFHHMEQISGSYWYGSGRSHTGLGICHGKPQSTKIRVNADER
jgi:hypothetical protein